MSHPLLVCTISAMLAATAWAVDSADPYAARHAATLRAHGIEADSAAALEYLKRLRPDENRRQRIAELIRQLGDDDFTLREAASRQLTQMPILPLAELSQAVESGAAEVRWRARRILSSDQQQNSQLLLAALKTIAADPPSGAVEPILGVLPLCRRPYLLDAAIHALRSAAGPNDIDLLKSLLRSKQPIQRQATVAVLAALLPPTKFSLLYPLLDDSNELVVLRTAQAIADRGDRRSLPALVRLLDSTDATLRADSAAFLQALTGQNQGFASYDHPERRAIARAAWNKWLETDGRTARLNLPVVKWQTGRGPLRGNTLISTGSAGRVMELDPSGKEIWSFAIDAWSAEKLPNGNLLIGSYSAKRLVEVDPVKGVVWEYPSISAMTAKPLPGGNVLVADFSGHRVVEIDRRKSIVWKYETPDECFDAERLPNGNTIFGCPNLVREVTPDGKTVRELKIQGRLNGLQPLPGGNILVANYGAGKVQEYSPDGKIVWEFEEAGPCDVFRLASGATLVTTASRIIEVGPDKKVVREISKAKYGSARR